MTFEQLWTEWLKLQLAKITTSNGYNITCGKVIEGYYPNASNEDNFICFQIGNVKNDWKDESLSYVKERTMKFVLYFLTKGYNGTSENEIQNNKAIADLRKFIEKDKSISDVSNTIDFESLNDNINYVIYSNEDRYTDNATKRPVAVLVCEVNYNEETANALDYYELPI